MPVKSLTRGDARRRRFVGLAATLLAAAGPASATAPVTALQPLDAIRAAAERALRAELANVPGVQLDAGRLDPRLRLPACQAALETRATPPRNSQARALVRVGCSAGATWTLNVPVEIRRQLTVFVLRRSITRGETLSAGDVVAEQREVPGLASSLITRLEDLAGRLARRTLAEGTAVSADALTPPLLIHRGQTVTLTASAGGIEVRAPGRALADAGARQRLRVQNLNSLKVVEGIAESVGVVRVNP